MDRRGQIEAAIEAQERLRGTVDDEIIEAAVAALRASLEDIAPSTPRRRLATVLFADIAGFTAWSEGFDEEEVGASMSSVWDRLDRVVLDHGGRIDKHIGDSLMAVWGAERSREDDPENAIRAALEIRAAFREVTGSGELAGSGLELRMGVNTGPVILREVGSTGEFTALGDAVNTASRLESVAEVGQILVGHDTYRHVRGVFGVTELPPLKLKGKRDNLRAYQVDGVRPRAFRLASRGVEGVETEMVGRVDELESLERLFEEMADEGKARVATIVGEAGLGKSRLVSELVEWLQLRPDEVFLMEARADPRQTTTPYALVKDLLFFRFEIGHDEPTDEAVAKLEEGFRVFGDSDRGRAHLSAHLIGLDVMTSPHVAPLADDPKLLSERGVTAVTFLLARMSEVDPVVLVAEDTHWADRPSLDLIGRAISATAESAVLFILTTRPTGEIPESDWGGETMVLTPLTPSDSGHLARDLLRNIEYLPEDMVDAIVETAEGNPFYVEEYVRSMIDSGYVEITDSGWEVDTTAGFDWRTPPTLTAIVQSRLDTLPDEERALLQQASVVGRVFWDSVLACEASESGAVAAERIATGLNRLVGRELVARHFDSAFRGAAEYGFTHNLLRDVTYDSVLKEDRRRYHRVVAGWLAENADPDGWAAVIADHLGLAGDPTASGWYVRAADVARLRYANEEAVNAYQQALHVGGLDADEQLAAYDAIGDLSVVLSRYDDALKAHETMLKKAREAGDPVAAARALTGVLFARLRIGSADELLSTSEEALRAVGSLQEPDESLRSEALRGAGFAALRLGDHQTVLERARMAVQAAELGGDMRGLALSLNLMSLGHASLGDIEAADAALERALDIDRERGDRRSEGATLINLGENARRRGDYVRAEQRYREALEIHRDNADHDQETLAKNNLGGALVGQGRFEEAVPLLNEAIAVFEQTGRVEYLSEARRFMAEALLGLGDHAAAVAAARNALADGVATGAPEQVCLAWRILGRLADESGGHIPVGTGEVIAAEECYRRSVDASGDDQVERAVTLAYWARSVLGADPTRARQMWSEAVATLEPLGLTGLAGKLE